MKEKIIYIGELDADVDDVIAAEYLHKNGVLKAVVLDPEPKTPKGLERKKELEELGVTVLTKMPPVAEYVFVGGALTKVARYLVTHKIDYLVMNGGFVGCNIVTQPLEKFKGKQAVRTFNFNCDVDAADRVLKSSNIGQVVLIGKNVCHNKRNTLAGIWKQEKALLEKYGAKPTKLQHDMLACREGLIQTGLMAGEPYLDYQIVYPYNTGLKGNMTMWGSKEEKTEYQPVLAAIGWK